jgi:transposase
MERKPLNRTSSRNFFLLGDDIHRLEQIVLRSENWRERQRAQTLLVLHETRCAQQTAERIGIHEKTVGATRRDWFERGYESLVDRPRPGAPHKLSAQALERLLGQAQQAPSTSRQLLAQHLQEGGAQVHVNTVVNALRAAGLTWKRTRHSLKKDATKTSSEMLSKSSPE